MQIKFRPDVFKWLQENCVNQSIAAYVSNIVDKEIRVSMKGATNEEPTKKNSSTK